MRKSGDKADFRCCYCGTTNTYTYTVGERKQRLHKKKTLEVPCSTCGDTVLGNKRGA